MLRRHSLGGFWDRSHNTPGEVTGYGPNFSRSVKRYQERLKRAKERGTWRYKNAVYKSNKGTYIDRDWDIIDF